MLLRPEGQILINAVTVHVDFKFPTTRLSAI